MEREDGLLRRAAKAPSCRLRLIDSSSNVANLTSAFSLSSLTSDSGNSVSLTLPLASAFLFFASSSVIQASTDSCPSSASRDISSESCVRHAGRRRVGTGREKSGMGPGPLSSHSLQLCDARMVGLMCVGQGAGELDGRPSLTIQPADLVFASILAAPPRVSDASHASSLLELRPCTRALACSNHAPAPSSPTEPESPNPIDFPSDPFTANLGEVEALMASITKDLEASGVEFTLPTSDPRNHRETARNPDSEQWRLAEQDKFTSLRDEYKVFHPVDRKDQHGKVISHKVRLGAQGFSQRAGMDFRETPTSTRRTSTGALDEELYMRVPEGVDDPALVGKVLLLDRALYGLKQAGRVWNHRIHATLVRLGYTHTRSDACVYVRSEGGQFHYIALYVDNLLFRSKLLDEITRIEDGLREEYGIKDIGEAEFIPGIQVHRCADNSIFLSQRVYLEDVLLCLGQAGCRTAPTPMISNLQLRVRPEDHTPAPKFRHKYMQAVHLPVPQGHAGLQSRVHS
ncbi:hypothetical protein JCM8097_004881 [Rhodosporidiobolus ruineniae]